MNKKVTHAQRADFLARLADCGNVSRASAEAGLDRVQLYRDRSSNEDFFNAWEEAASIGAARLEDEARRRAVEGWLEPVHYQGVQVDQVRKYSDTLLIVLLKAHHPDKYRERADVNQQVVHSGTVNVIAEIMQEIDGGTSHVGSGDT